MAQAASLNVYSPPQIPLGNDAWQRWFNDVVWPIVGKGVSSSGPQGTFDQLQVGKARFTRDNESQELLDVDQGIYVNYSSTVNNIIYGFACNVHRGAGAPFVVGAQINALGDVPGVSGVFGIACTAVASPNTGSIPLIAFEPDIASLTSSNSSAKWGMNPVFKDRGDGANNTTEGLGSNLYNYFAEGLVFTSQVRSGDGEFCGWSCGIDFLDASLDQSTVPAWSAATPYGPGMIVSNAGVLWKAIQSSTNQSPIAGSSFWVQHTFSGTTNLAVGIDFSSMSTTSMGRMASAIRLRNTMQFHWEETGAIGSRMDSATSKMILVQNQGSLRYAVDVGTAVVTSSQTPTALGGGAVPTLGTIGGSGPATAAQNAWEQVVLNGTTYWRPLWR